MNNESTIYKGARICGISDINKLCPEDRKTIEDFIQRVELRNNELKAQEETRAELKKGNH